MRLPGAAIWADSGAGVGLGHLSRCCAVAQSLSRLGSAVSVFAGDEDGAAYARSQGASARTAPLREFVDACGAADIAIVDSYRLSHADRASLEGASPVVAAFDDRYAEDLPADVVINAAGNAERARYTGRATRYLLGPQYFALRADFAALPPHTAAPDVSRVLVSLGAGGSRGLIHAVAAVAVRVFPAARVAATVSPSDVPEPAGASPVELLRMPQDFPTRVQQAGILICGGGQTLYEAISVGTPAVGLCLGDDQREHLASMAALGGCLAVTPVGDLSSIDVQGLERALDSLRTAAARESLSARARTLVDGGGADRIAGVLTAMAAQRGTVCRG